MHRPNKLVDPQDELALIVNEAIKTSKLLDCIIERNFSDIMVTHNRLTVHVDFDTSTGDVNIDCGQLTIDSRFSPKNYHLMKLARSDDGATIFGPISLGDPNAIKIMADIFKAIKSCWR